MILLQPRPPRFAGFRPDSRQLAHESDGSACYTRRLLRVWPPPMCRAVLPVVLLIAGVNAISGQTAHPASREAPLREWVAAVSRHEPRRLAPSAVEIAAWPDGRLTNVVADVRELGRFLARAHERFRRTGEESAFAFDGGVWSMSEVQQLLG